MLNAKDTVDVEALQVLDYANPVVEHAMKHGTVNVTDEVILANVRSSVRRGYPQLRPFPPQPDVVCIVGSGPSLNATLPELTELYFQGAKIVTLNGAYHWCIEHNLRPSTQIVLDARASNARFLNPPIPRCRYAIASQCAPEVWDAVEGRDDVWIFHAASAVENPATSLLDEFYAGQWFGVGGGVTVATRALYLLSMCGWRRFHLFGIDSCWTGGEHHAFAQPENQKDQRFTIVVDDPAVPGSAKKFTLSPWHLKQVEDFLAIMRVSGDHFLLSIHGEGILAYLMTIGAGANLTITEQA